MRCDFDGVVRLWAAQNNNPARPIAIGQPRTQRLGGRTFTVWDFNDVNVSAAQNPQNKLHFFVTVDGVETRRNVWTHGSDARTISPAKDTPNQVISTIPSAIDAKIEIVWPHNGQPVSRAERANITAYLFSQDSLTALAANVQPKPVVRLYRADNNGISHPASAAPIGVSRTVNGNGLSWLAYDFNDIDVRAANDPANRIYFWVESSLAPSAPNIWVHGASGLTNQPEQDIPAQSCR